MPSTIPEHHVVVGAGIAGCVSAILRRAAGYEVTIVDKAASATPGVHPVCTDTSTIVSENHSGAEYPFDPRSAADCLDGRIANERFFPELIYGGKRHTRIIASARMTGSREDIRQQCRTSLARLREHYRTRVAQDPYNRVLGDPDDFVRELPGGPDGVLDASATFITPQRGINPAYTAALLAAEIDRIGVRLRPATDVKSIVPRSDGRYVVSWDSTLDGPGRQVCDQVSIAAAVNGFQLATALNPRLALPVIYCALRQILLMRLPDAAPTSRDFTCLKLEHEHGGMFSPFNPHDILVYYPPQAHIAVTTMRPGAGLPTAFVNALSQRLPRPDERASRSVEHLAAFYPEVASAEFTGIYHKIAVNTVDDSRIRRNMGTFAVAPGCNLMVLPKWTMAVRNALRDVELALQESVRRSHISVAAAVTRLGQLTRYRVPTPEAWSDQPELLRHSACRHAIDMNLPTTVADSFLTAGVTSSRPAGTGNGPRTDLREGPL